MEQINLGYSLKDIPLPDDKTQIQILIQSWEVTDKAMRWKILKTFNPEAFGNVVHQGEVLHHPEAGARILERSPGSWKLLSPHCHVFAL